MVLIEANRIGHGVTGHTTGKVSSQHGMIYAQLRSKHGAEAAAAYGDANQAALEWIAARVARDEIDCDFRRRASYAWSDSRSRGRGRGAGGGGRRAFRPRSSRRRRCRSAVAGAVRFDDQAEFHAQKYLQALAARLPEVYEHTHAVHAGVVRAHARRPDRRRAHRSSRPTSRSRTARSRSPARTRSAPTRSRAGSPASSPDGMFISSGSPTRSIRAIPVDGSELLMVGGEGHRTGTGGDTEQRYARA